MNKQELLNKIKELEKQLSQLKEELNTPEIKCWKPKYGDVYYYIHKSGIVGGGIWKDDECDNELWSIGNCFQTKEEAEFEVERLKVIVELKRFAEQHNTAMDWNDGRKPKWFIYNHNDDMAINIGCDFKVKRHDIYFSSEKIAQQAVKEIGEDRIKKYYLMV